MRIQMDKIMYDMLALLSCGVNGTKPSQKLVDSSKEYLTQLYNISRAHFVDALTGTVLKQAGVQLTGEWEQSIAKDIRKVMLFDAERSKLFAFMEQNKIWYLPLKGIIIKDYYPSVGMRQMSDNDILFDEAYAGKIRDYMISCGYKVTNFNLGNHDVYMKAPVYNFELHRALYDTSHENSWEQYYRDIKSRLILDEGTSYGYHMTKEDFYIYIISHGYKHYSKSGTGIRTLLDYYVYLKKNRQDMDFAYIERECEKLGIASYEQESRSLCQIVFESPEKLNSTDAGVQQLLTYYLTSGVYGTEHRKIENSMKQHTTKDGHISKLKYVLGRLFPVKQVYIYYPVVKHHKWMLPGVWAWRFIRLLLEKDRRHKIYRECNIVIKTENHSNLFK